MTTSQGSGAVVLAAYRPDPDLFSVQLRSIRDQTRDDFRCLIGADGGQEAVRTLVHEIVGDDPRFEVIGWDDNLGFYLNFERLLRAVPDDVAWVALSDQDDRWYPDKLERLVPLLDDAVLCSARWRVVDAARSATPPRRRHGLSLAGVLAQNPVPGAAMVFRRTLLGWALPFPDSAAPTAAHDHWLLACAAAVDSCPVSPGVLQDYVQHGGNVIGHEGQGGIVDPLRTRFGWTLRRARHPRRLVAEAERLSFGWRRVMAQALAERLTAADLHEHGATLRAYAGARRLPVYRELARSCYRGDLRFPTALTFVVGSFPGTTDSGER